MKDMRFALVSSIAIVSATVCLLLFGSGAAGHSGTRKSILVELFTSEGCSSCPPADAFLSKLDQQPLPGAEFVVLSEHVDYWNYLGWQDPYSSHSYGMRQERYAGKLGSGSVYTPQIIVDGAYELVGTTQAANNVFTQALDAPKIPIYLSSISLERTNILKAHVECGPIPTPLHPGGAEVYVALALNRAESQVYRGENGGRRLSHTAVVRNLSKIGSVLSGQSFMQDFQLKVEPGTDPRNLRVIAFLQEPHQGRIIGAAMELVEPNSSVGGK